MQYIIIPTEAFEQADMQLAQKLGLDMPRKSVDGTEVLMHIESYNRLFGETAPEESQNTIYESDSEEFEKLLCSQAWTSDEAHEPE